jgi:heterotetrameric sarcosine oxidase delta subunit
MPDPIAAFIRREYAVHRGVWGDAGSPAASVATSRIARHADTHLSLLRHPACETELAPGGEAHLKRFGPGSSDDDFEAYLFLRPNVKGVHFERWRHAMGCGKWFLAAR